MESPCRGCSGKMLKMSIRGGSVSPMIAGLHNYCAANHKENTLSGN